MEAENSGLGGSWAPRGEAFAPLEPEELGRYGRQLVLPEIGLTGQARLKKSRVAVVGLGGLGSPAAIYLAAAGVGTLGLIDPDCVHLSNLHRQTLYAHEDVGKRKCDVAAERLQRINRHVATERHPVALTAHNAMEILAGYDLVIDGTDNFPTRYLVNDACVLLGRPNVYGSVLRFEGRVSVFCTTDGPCYRCLFPEPPAPGSVPDCADAGVLGVVPGHVGLLQATEALKWLTGAGQPLIGRLLVLDMLRMRFQAIAVRRDPTCPACGTRVLRRLVDYEAFCGVRPANPAVASLSPIELKARLDAGGAPQLVDVRETWEWRIARIPGALLLPLGQLDEGLRSLDAARETVVYCHHGTRSLSAAARLASAGFARVANLDGGIDRWSVEVDATQPRY